MIVKNLLIVAGVVGISAAASGAEESKANWKIGAKVRLDNSQSTVETTPAATGAEKVTTKSSSVGLNGAEFTLTGTQGSDSMAITYHLDTNTLYSATIGHKFSDMLTATFGHMPVLSQGFEAAANEIDEYMTSMAHDARPSNASGARFNLGFGDHGVAFQVAQGVSSFSNDGTTSTFDSSGGLSWALQYTGHVAGVRPIFTYTVVNTSSTKGTSVTDTGVSSAVNYGNGYQTQMGIGVEADVAGAAVGAELATITFKKQDVAGSTEKDNTIQSMIISANYPFGATSALFKLTSDSHKFGADGGIGDVTQTQIALGAEHRLDSSCRLHAVYTSRNTSTKASASASEKVAASGFNIGVTAAM